MPYLPRIIATSFCIFCASQVSAFTVTTQINDDLDGECSIQEAIAAANLDSATGVCTGTDFDTISFAPGMFVSDDVSKLVLDLTISELNISISDDLDIVFPSPVDIDGTEFAHEINVTLSNDIGKNTPIFSIQSNVSFVLTGWNIDGSTSNDATIASLSNNANLTFDTVKIENFANENTSSINTDGLIHTSNTSIAGTVIINDSIFSNNQTLGNGAALNLEASLLQVNNTLFLGNTAYGDALSDQGSGGAIAIWGSTDAEIRTSTLLENQSSSNGGAIANLDSTSTLKIENSNLMLNTADENGGAIYSAGPIALFSSSFLTNQAGANTTDDLNHKGAALFINNDVSAAEIYNSFFYLNLISGMSRNDCSGPVSILEYSLLTFTDDCLFPETVISVITDANNVPVQAVRSDQQEIIGYITNSTQVIDQGNPDGCAGIEGTALEQDINGNSRSISINSGAQGTCDIGSTEFKPFTILMTTDKAIYDVSFNETLERQEKTVVTLTIENTGNVTLSDMTIDFNTPFGYSVIIAEDSVTGSIRLASNLSLDPGATEHFEITFTPETDNLSGVVTFTVNIEDAYLINMGPSENISPRIILKMPLKDEGDSEFFIFNTDDVDEKVTNTSSKDSSGNGSIFWLLPALGLLTSFRRNRPSAQPAKYGA